MTWFVFYFFRELFLVSCVLNISFALLQCYLRSLIIFIHSFKKLLHKKTIQFNGFQPHPHQIVLNPSQFSPPCSYSTSSPTSSSNNSVSYSPSSVNSTYSAPSIPLSPRDHFCFQLQLRIANLPPSHRKAYIGLLGTLPPANSALRNIEKKISTTAHRIIKKKRERFVYSRILNRKRE